MMMNRTLRENALIIVTLLIAMVLSILPQPVWAATARPQWVFVVLLFWLVYVPQKIGPILAWCLGLYVDLLLGTVLGEHALIFVLVTYLVQRWLRFIEAMPLWQQILGVGVFSACYVLITALFTKWQGGLVWHWQLLLPILANMMIWPWLYFLCRDVRPRYDYTLLNTKGG